MTKEKILNIEDYAFCEDYIGYRITTNNRIIEVLIDNEQQCCEGWGYMCSEDDVTTFVGGDLLSFDVVNDMLEVKEFPKLCSYLEAEECIFINFKTSKGDLQIVVYNSHNGYYGHEVIVRSKNNNEIDYNVLLDDCL